MPKTRKQKEKEVQEMSDTFSHMHAAVFANFSKINIQDEQELRKEARTQDAQYVIAKKTLLKIALENAGVADINPITFHGPVSTIVGLGDAMVPARVATAFAKKHESFSIIGGIFEKKFMDAAQITALANLPTRQELLGYVVGSIAAPLSGFVNVLAGNLRGFVQVIKARQEKLSS